MHRNSCPKYNRLIKRYLYRLFLILPLLQISPFDLYGQSTILQQLHTTVQSANEHTRTLYFQEKQHGAVNKILVLPLRFYKSVLSDQIAADCMFEPTCSVYCYHSLHTYGFWGGIFATADRLMRCNSSALSNGSSQHFNSNGKIIDYPSCSDTVAHTIPQR